jgi:hypothetical protein
MQNVTVVLNINAHYTVLADTVAGTWFVCIGHLAMALYAQNCNGE